MLRVVKSQRFGRFLLTITHGPIAIERWFLAIFIFAAFSAEIIGGSGMYMHFSSLLYG